MMMTCGVFFFFKQKTAYEMRISDWSSDVCSSDLTVALAIEMLGRQLEGLQFVGARVGIGPGLRHVEAELDALGVGGVVAEVLEIGRASCRERVCQYV